MRVKQLMKNNSRINKKALLWSGIGLIAAGSVAGVAAGSVYVQEHLKSTNGLDDKFITQTQWFSPTPVNHASNQQQHIAQLSKLDFHLLNAQSQIDGKIANFFYDYSLNGTYADLDYRYITKQEEKVAAKLALLRTFSTSNRLELQNISGLLGSTIHKTTKLNDQQFDEQDFLILNQKEAWLSLQNNSLTNSLELKIKVPTKDNQDFSLDTFDAQFKSVAGDAKTVASRDEILQNLSKDPKKLTKPENIWLLWANRDALIMKLNSLALLAYAHEQKNIVNQEIWDIIDGQYQIASSNDAERQYMSFVIGSKKPISDFLIDEKTLSYQKPVQEDQLLTLLQTFYTSQYYSPSNNQFNFNQPQGPTKLKDQEMFYSWNLKQLSLISPYVISIDYASFYHYFKADQQNQYHTKEFLISQKADHHTNSYFNNLVNFKKYFHNAYAYNDLLTAHNPLIAKKQYAQAFVKYVERASHLQTIHNHKLMTKLSNQQSILIGLSVIILLIGIIVSVLYKLAGLLNALLMFFSYVLALVFLIKFNTGFSAETYAALFVFNILNLFGLMQLNKGMQFFLQQGYSYKNALVKSLNDQWIKYFYLYMLMLFSGMVFMFFNDHTNQAFGTNVMIILFSYFLISYIVFLGILYLLAIVCAEKPNCHLYREYLAHALLINQQQFGVFVPKTNSRLQAFIEHMHHKAYLIATLVLIGLIIIIGMLVLGLVNRSHDFFANTLVRGYISEPTPIDAINTKLYPSVVGTQVINHTTEIIFDTQSATYVDDLDKISAQFHLVINLQNTAFWLQNARMSVYSYLIIFVIALCWGMIWLRITSALVIITTVFTFVSAGIGLVYITQIPINEYSLIGFNTFFILLLLFIFVYLGQIRMRINSKQIYQKRALKNLLTQASVENWVAYNIIYYVMLASLLILMFFLPVDLIMMNLIVFVSLAVMYPILANVMLKLNMATILLAQKIRLKTLNSHHNQQFGYDKYDEQEILNINKF
ncbi:hypothetical protein [Ureaplasma zalophigenitalium]|uniref:Peptide transporter n=1 Tax=Ureaplasma zalophigenitalium TaxID=907723 RepID=A0ABT3BPM0_9BACT|nr:hypothetical protein [Ureaplasma zalophigenitalium]MCV3754177.1 hypothetical protein [Ureaplasma zalophigenitalium]